MYRYITLLIVLLLIWSGPACGQQPDSILSVTQKLNQLLGKKPQKDQNLETLSRKSGTQDTPDRFTEVPFGSQGNKIKLVVSNSLRNSSGRFRIRANEVPNWIKVTPSTKKFTVEPRSSKTVKFRFSVKEDAPVGKESSIDFSIVDLSGFRSKTTVGIKVAAPPFKLLPNYPNPFNPSTTIQYRLPSQMDVQVTVYNILGRKVATLADKTQKAGQHELRWDASRMASGLYFYRIIAENKERRIVKQKKMMLIK